MKRWDKAEIELLIKMYPTATNIELRKAFPDRTDLSIYKKGKHLGFYKEPEVEFKNRSDARRGEKAPNWKGGFSHTKKGYVMQKCPDHPRADLKGYVMEHILIFEKETGIVVPPNCVIHHLNGDKKDNRIENLCMMSFGAHSTYHNNKRWRNGR